MIPPSTILVYLFLLLWTPLSAHAGTATIDDTQGDSQTGVQPVYSPASGVWNDNNCQNCRLRPDREQAFLSNWHAARFTPQLGSMSIDLKFNGTGIDVFFVLANNNVFRVPTETVATFVLDGTGDLTFTHQPDTSHEFLYNQKVYSKQDLPNKEHTLSIVTQNLDRDVYVNFDYARYFFPDAEPSAEATSTEVASSAPEPSQSTGQESGPAEGASSQAVVLPAAAIAGIVIGSLIFVFAVGGTLWALIARLGRRGRPESVDEEKHHPVTLFPQMSSTVPYGQQLTATPRPYPSSSKPRLPSEDGWVTAAHHATVSSSMDGHSNGGGGVDVGVLSPRQRNTIVIGDIARAGLQSSDDLATTQHGYPFNMGGFNPYMQTPSGGGGGLPLDAAVVEHPR